jgi:hypothetical protein
MPGVISRLQPDDSIAQFEIAALQRFEEATLLVYGLRAYSAVYLYGYAIEMWLKAAYFHNEGVIANINSPVTDADRARAWAQRVAAGAPARRTNQHDVEIWAHLLIYIRRTAGIHAPYIPLIESTLLNYSAGLRDHWNVEMRYQHAPVQPVEVNSVRTVAE